MIHDDNNDDKHNRNSSSNSANDRSSSDRSSGSLHIDICIHITHRHMIHNNIHVYKYMKPDDKQYINIYA